MTRSSMAATHQRLKAPLLYDPFLLFSAAFIIAMGLLMVASTSISLSEHFYHNPFRFLLRQSCFLCLGLLLTIITVKIPMKFWERYSMPLLALSLVLLVAVLIPGIGKQVNGSMRWLGFGPFGGQVSELAKLTVVLYLASYLVRRSHEVQTQLRGFIKPIVILAIISALLLKEPDFGATTVIVITALGMLFLAGVKIWQFAALLMIAVLSLGVIAISSPYRVTRLTTFLNPWANQFDSGYQLTQSLIAFGRGGWFGVGLGGSVQKLFYLPEAHTDFLFSILTEELGLFGALLVLGAFIILVSRALIIGYKAAKLQRYFSAYVAYGLGLWVSFQVLVNIGVSTGMLPTKGLTLPLMSYGGSSLMINCIIIGLLLRIDYESRRESLGLTHYHWTSHE